MIEICIKLFAELETQILIIEELEMTETEDIKELVNNINILQKGINSLIQKIKTNY
ncbi:MAG: four helix bundle protein [bacterium]|nr:four helix bundle protein [bacterium]